MPGADRLGEVLWWAVARWYLKGEGVTGYRAGDRDEITRVRIATMNVG